MAIRCLDVLRTEAMIGFNIRGRLDRVIPISRNVDTISRLCIKPSSHRRPTWLENPWGLEVTPDVFQDLLGLRPYRQGLRLVVAHHPEQAKEQTQCAMSALPLWKPKHKPGLASSMVKTVHQKAPKWAEDASCLPASPRRG